MFTRQLQKSSSPRQQMIPIKFLRWFVALFALVLVSCQSNPIGFQRPNGIAVAPDGTLYVMDFGNYRIVHLLKDGTIIDKFGKFGNRPDQIYYGWDMSLDPQGNIYIGHLIREKEITSHDGVKVFSPEGRFLREVGAQDYDNLSSEKANKPYGIDVDESNRLYVADYGTATLRIFDPSGKLLRSFFGKENPTVSFSNPGDVAVDDLRGLLYISDFTGNRIDQFRIVFGQTGNPELFHIQSIGKYGQGAGDFAFPSYLTVDDQSGHFYVGDQANRRIQAFDSDGNYLFQCAPPNVLDWQVMGLAVDRDGMVYAADALNNVIWSFTPTGQFFERIEVKQ